MSIQEHLNKIRNAIKGSEVRESIAKGIETAYDDASEKDNANMEVKIARGAHPNLRSRLEEVDSKQQQTTAQLAQKANSVEVSNQLSLKRDKSVPISEHDISSSLAGAISGGTAIEVLNIPRNHSVTHEKTTFLYPSENLLNKHNMDKGYLINPQTGEIGESPNYDTSGFLPVSPGEYSVTQSRAIGVYNEEKEMLEVHDLNPMVEKTITITESGYIRVSIRNHPVNIFYAMVVRGNVLPDDYVPHQIELDTNINIANENIKEKISKHNVGFIKQNNLFDKNKVIDDHILNVINGEPVQSELTIGVYSVSGFIPVKKGLYSLSVNRNLCFYDIDKNTVKTFDENVSLFNAEDDGFIRVSMRSNTVDTFIVNEGETLLPYSDYGTYSLDSSIEVANTQNKEHRVSVHFGDSITANGIIVDRIGEHTGFTTHNFGVGGTRLVDLEVASTGYQKLNFLDLLRAKINDDWTKVDEAVLEIGDPVITGRMEQWKQMDMDAVNYLSFMYGTNDISVHSIQLGEEDSRDTYTVYGALNVALEMIMTNWPHLRVFVFSAIYRPIMANSDGLDSDEYSSNGVFKLYDIGNAMGEKAKEFKTPFKHMYYESGINKYNWEHYIDDGTHPNQVGDELLAEVMGRFIHSN